MAARLREIFLSGSKQIQQGTHIVHSQEITAPINYSNWTIPQESIESLYKIGTFDFKTAFSVKTHEETLSLNEEFQSIHFLIISKHINKKCVRVSIT